ncbi:hypothetical protein CHS0354_030936 [Potamilus streckersoni]|uniref:VWFC domain-containing protein n=1 Tax=Potamilus streckersoni TaxID=2493646 RepID=A0AAE0RYM3_9BIVA|nr:hypothetical protein CHS0354_030936 [Potamilus streckersoni]
MPSSDPCAYNCICKGFDRIECSNIMACSFPPCGNPIAMEGHCCPVCVGCEHNGVYYNTGDQMPSDNPCETNCYCGLHGLRACATMDCPPSPCENPVYVVGECCPRCGCQQNGQFYSIGDPMPSDNPCETNCYCAEDGLRACATMDCPPSPCENPIYLVGECCPRCGCQQNGQFYSIGEAMPSDTPCGFDCTCGENGQIQCTMVTCAPVYCEISFVPMGRCCPVCGCIYRGRLFEIGDIVRNVRCKPLVCQSNGIIKAEPVECPNLRLECINPVIPIGKCCPECINGPWI